MRVAQQAQTGTGLVQSAAVRWPDAGQSWRWLGYLMLAIAVVLVGLPMYWMLIAAFKTNQEIFTSPPTWIPLAPTFDNFPAAWRQAPFGNFYINSLVYTLVSGSAKILQAVFKALPGGEIVLVLTGLDKNDKENVLELKLPKGVKKITITLETGESKTLEISDK